MASSSAVDGQFLRVTTPSEGVALVSFTRPPVNAFNRPMWREIPVVFKRLSYDPSVRVIIIASSQKFFTAGLDLTDTDDLLNTRDSDPSRTAFKFRPLIEEFQLAITSIEKCRVPVIAAVHGLAYGLGVDILSACDIRYASSDAVFSVREVQIGMAADVGSLARLPHTTGNDSALREWALTGRDVSANEALSAGFLSKVVPEKGKEAVLAAALETAKLIATKSPVAVAGTKHLLLHSRDHSVQENLDYTATWNMGMLQSADMPASIKAFRSKQPAKYEPLPGLSDEMKEKAKL